MAEAIQLESRNTSQNGNANPPEERKINLTGNYIAEDDKEMYFEIKADWFIILIPHLSTPKVWSVLMD
jgi:hypothetical protein